MGKKRRLKSAKAKFALKHANHPRVKLLANLTEEPTTAAGITTVETTDISETTEDTPTITLTPKIVNTAIEPTIKTTSPTTKTAPIPAHKGSL